MTRRRRDLDATLALADRWLAGAASPAQRYPLLFERGLALDAAGRHREAYDSFVAANADQVEATPHRRDPERAHAQIAALAELYRSGLPGVPSAGGAAADGPRPVFLVGFPRSGTTLLDQVLDSHPEIAVIEERPLVPGMIARLAGRRGPYPDALARLDDEDRTDLRSWYRAAIDRHLPTGPARYVVDKMPLNMVHAGLIRSVFPEARFLLALRHPCDVVLSGFMQNFLLNEWMTALTSLEGAARLYRAVFGLWETYVAAFVPPFAVVRYERLVADLKREVAPVLEFLDLPWHDDLVRFHEHARDRGVLATPSAGQVTQPIYRTALDRWRRYDFVMDPIAAQLSDEIGRYGYAEENR